MASLTLAVDIGGSLIKMAVLDEKGNIESPSIIKDTPFPASVTNLLELLIGMRTQVGEFDRISLGFPGVVRQGIIYTAVNLHPSWIGFNLQKEISKTFNVPTLVKNDADIQGYGSIIGDGVELVLTLGTGMGAALFVDGCLVPNLELGHHPFKDNRSYEQWLGAEALNQNGFESWHQILQQAINQVRHTFNFDLLYLGGGNARLLKKDEFGSTVVIVDNSAGLVGGVKLWKLENRKT